MSPTNPLIVNKDVHNTQALLPLGVKARQFDENWLQELLFHRPELLPVQELAENPGKLIPLAREYAVTSGSIDLLLATADGMLCLVETKLWRNPEAHRTVLAQLLDYAKDLSRLSFTSFKLKVETVAHRHGYPPDLFQIMAQALGPIKFDSIRFEEGVRRTLATGSFLLLIVGDQIRPAVAMLSEILGAAPNLEYHLGLVEIRFFHMNGDESWPLLAVPTLVGRSLEVTRAVVRIRYEEKRPEVDVSAAMEGQPTSTGRTNLETFLKELPADLEPIFRACLERWNTGPFMVYWGTTGFSLRHAPKNKLETIFDAYPTYIGLILEKHLTRWANPETAYREYRTAIGHIAAVQQTFARNGRYVYYNQLIAEEVQTLLTATDRFAQAIVQDSPL